MQIILYKFSQCTQAKQTSSSHSVIKRGNMFYVKTPTHIDTSEKSDTAATTEPRNEPVLTMCDLLPNNA